MEVAHLHKLYLEATGVSTDTRRIAQGQMFFALKGPNFDGNQYATMAIEAGASYVVVDDPEMNLSEQYLLVPDVLQALQSLANYHRHYHKAKIIGITGSNGKTTTKELLHAVLSTRYNTLATVGNLNNHIGVPLTLLNIGPDTEYAIIEMGANQPDDILELCNIATPDYAYITNIGEAHLEGLVSLHGVYKTKTALFRSVLSNGGICFVNQFDPFLLQHPICQAQRRYLKSDVSLHEKNTALLKVNYRNRVVQTHLTGSYNIDNVRAAITIGEYIGVEVDDIAKAIQAYIPTNKRSQIIEYSDHTIILDAYNANPTSMAKSLQNGIDMQSDRKFRIAIIGDMLELGDLSLQKHIDIVRYAIGLGYHKIILVGNEMISAFNQLQIDSETSIVHCCIDLEEAIAAYDEIDKSNSLILLKASRGIQLESLLT